MARHVLGLQRTKKNFLARHEYVAGAPRYVSASARQRSVMGFYGHPEIKWVIYVHFIHDSFVLPVTCFVSRQMSISQSNPDFWVYYEHVEENGR